MDYNQVCYASTDKRCSEGGKKPTSRDQISWWRKKKRNRVARSKWSDPSRAWRMAYATVRHLCLATKSADSGNCRRLTGKIDCDYNLSMRNAHKPLSETIDCRFCYFWAVLRRDTVVFQWSMLASFLGLSAAVVFHVMKLCRPAFLTMWLGRTVDAAILLEVLRVAQSTVWKTWC